MVHLRSESICPLTGGGGLSADKMVGSPGPLLRTLLLRSSGFASKPPIMSSQSHPGASGPRIAVLTGPLGAMAAVYRPTEALPLSFQRQWDLGSLMGKLLVSEIHMHTRNYTHTHTHAQAHAYTYACIYGSFIIFSKKRLLVLQIFLHYFYDF